MAKNRPEVPVRIKRELLEESGGKCANPGCPNQLVQFHHIQEWSVYQTHDQNHMVALCPTCHDQVHRGDLRITDEDLYAWKQIELPASAETVDSFFWAKRGGVPELRFGSNIVVGTADVVVLELAPHSRLSFRVEQDDCVITDLTIADTTGTKIIEFANRDVTHWKHDRVNYCHRTGQHVVTVPTEPDFLPEWVIRHLEARSTNDLDDDGVELLNIRVVEPGVVEVAGLWIGQNEAVWIRDGAMLLLGRGLGEQQLIVGNTMTANGPISAQFLANVPRLGQYGVFANNRFNL